MAAIAMIQLNPAVLQRIGLCRFGLPIPGAKWLLAHSVADELRLASSRDAAWHALLSVIQDQFLESEVVELLAPAILVRHEPFVSTSQLQAKIDRPSLISDFFLQTINPKSIAVGSDATRHSGDGTSVFLGRSEVKTLLKVPSMPPILALRLESLEEESERPFTKQWAFEFQTLCDRYENLSDGQWTYFGGGERGTSGSFVTPRGHAARSAYLRTLSLACHAWDMPRDRALDEALYAGPIDMSFLHVRPGYPPDWTTGLRVMSPRSEVEFSMAASATIATFEKKIAGRDLLHLNARLASTETYESELEIVSYLCAGDPLPPSEVFRLYGEMLGRVDLPRDNDFRIQVPSARSTGRNISVSRPGCYPAMVGAFSKHVGYFHHGLLERLPLLPANYADEGPLVASPGIGGMKICLQDKVIGALEIWHDQWKPVHNQHLGSHYGVSLSLESQNSETLLNVPGTKLRKVWRATLIERERSYDDWKPTEFVGDVVI